MYYNWYAEGDRRVLTTWPGGGPVEPFCSSVDNGWLGAALMVVRKALPGAADRADPVRPDALGHVLQPRRTPGPAG